MNNIVDFAGIGTVFSINEFVSRGRPMLGPNASLSQANVSTVDHSREILHVRLPQTEVNRQLKGNEQAEQSEVNRISRCISFSFGWLT